MTDEELAEIERYWTSSPTWTLERVPALLAEVKAAKLQNQEYVEALERARTYTGLEAAGCPLCTYVEGKFIAACSFHRKIEALELQLHEYREVIEGIYRLDLQWTCQRFPKDDANPRRNCRNTGSDPCEVCALWALLDQGSEKRVCTCDRAPANCEVHHPGAAYGEVCPNCGLLVRISCTCVRIQP